METTNDKKIFYIPSFARRRKRGLTKGQKRLMDEVLPRMMAEPETIRGLMKTYDEVALEIGFGKGEHLCHRAALSPQRLHIGCEIFDDGIAGALREIEARNLSNVRLHIYDARFIMEALPEKCLTHAYILFPDPWPKRREQKRRIVNQQTLDMLARLFKPGAMLQLATDHEDYLNWMCTHLAERNDFRLTATNQNDWLEPPEGHITTRYQEKAKAGRPYFLCYEFVG